MGCTHLAKLVNLLAQCAQTPNWAFFILTKQYLTWIFSNFFKVAKNVILLKKSKNLLNIL
jgi:hypothetical protein